MEEKLEEGDVVLCTVDRITKTTVFVNIEGNGEGTIITSEIAPGRIRNIRDYVIPGKKIVCKVLEINDSGNIHLSLRRVSEKEKKEVMGEYKREKTATAIIKSVINKQELIEKIKKEHKSLNSFLENCKKDYSLLKKYFPEEICEKIKKIIEKRGGKEVEIKKEFSLYSKESNGITIIKDILKNYKDNITYLAAGKFVLKIKAENYKKANQEIEKMLKDIEEKVSGKAKFEVKEKRKI